MVDLKNKMYLSCSAERCRNKYYKYLFSYAKANKAGDKIYFFINYENEIIFRCRVGGKVKYFNSTFTGGGFYETLIRIATRNVQEKTRIQHTLTLF